jgi:hypothetical protein
VGKVPRGREFVLGVAGVARKKGSANPDFSSRFKQHKKPGLSYLQKYLLLNFLEFYFIDPKSLYPSKTVSKYKDPLDGIYVVAILKK